MIKYVKFMRRRGPESGQYAIDVLSKAEEIFQRAGTDHRFVGGVITNLVGVNTSVIINAEHRIAVFTSNKEPSLIRSDRSVRDLDAIGFSPFPDSYREAMRLLREEAVRSRKQGLPYPPISIEPTYYSNWPGRNRLLQLVSTIDVDEGGQYHLTFGKVDQVTPAETFAPWIVTIGPELRLTSINPYGLPKRYCMRNASGIKRKDRAVEVVQDGIGFSKLDMLSKIADSIQKQSLAQGVDYQSLYETWDQFIDKLLHHPDPLTKAKAIATKVYWETVGTALSHGKGILKPFAGLGDRFTG